jgi:hypothetical protein
MNPIKNIYKKLILFLRFLINYIKKFFKSLYIYIKIKENNKDIYKNIELHETL